jgi:hypothetical protein
MIDNFLLIIILLTLIFILFQKKEKMNNDYLNSKSSLFLKKNVYSLNELIEIKKLPQYNKILNFDYGSNFNFIINNKISIYQDIIDPLQHTIEFDNTNYNLISLRWKISKFSYNNRPVGLELQLVHQNYESINNLIIILPLDLINNNNIESFKNINYAKMSNKFNLYTDSILEDYDNNNFIDPLYFQKGIKTDLVISNLKNIYNLNLKHNDSKYSLNKLISSEVLIPNYECCKNS